MKTAMRHIPSSPAVSDFWRRFEENDLLLVVPVGETFLVRMGGIA
jgi:hypothetical protein